MAAATCTFASAASASLAEASAAERKSEWLFSCFSCFLLFNYLLHFLVYVYVYVILLLLVPSASRDSERSRLACVGLDGPIATLLKQDTPISPLGAYHDLTRNIVFNESKVYDVRYSGLSTCGGVVCD